MPSLIRQATLKDAYRAAREKTVRHILLAGPPGVGKTTFCFEMGKLLKQPAWKYQFHADSTPAEMFGMYVPTESQGFEWLPGPIDLAYSNNGIIILDEVVEASGPCKTALYGALDNGPGGVISYVGRTFIPGKKYKAFATMNGRPTEGGLPDALLDRFDAVFCIFAPGDKQLEALDPDLREMCLDAYAGAKDPMLGPIVTYRMIRSFQKLRRILDLEMAVLSTCHGDEQLTGKFLEALAMRDPVVAAPGATLPVATTTTNVDVTRGGQGEEEDDEDWEDDDEDDEDEDEDDEDTTE